MVEFGIRTDRFLVKEIPDYCCPSCQNIGTTKLAIKGNYFELMWIPFFPLEKEGETMCNSCKKVTDEFHFHPSITALFESSKKELKTPWYSFLGIFILLLFGILLFW